MVRHSQMIGAEYVELDSEGAHRVHHQVREQPAAACRLIGWWSMRPKGVLPAPEVGALAPTVFARPRAQSPYFGTAPAVVMHDSEAFATMRGVGA